MHGGDEHQRQTQHAVRDAQRRERRELVAGDAQPLAAENEGGHGFCDGQLVFFEC